MDRCFGPMEVFTKVNGIWAYNMEEGNYMSLDKGILQGFFMRIYLLINWIPLIPQ